MNNNLVEKNSQEILSAALEYAKRGWPVLPIWGITEKGNCACMSVSCAVNNWGKHPAGYLVPNGLLNATTDETKIREWFENKNFLNVAIATGEKSFIAVDIDWIDKDPSKGLAPHEDFAETLTVKSGSGAKQFWYAPEANFINKQKIRSSIDIRANGGYVVAPPSNHKSGGRYEFLNNLPLNPFPQNVKNLITSKAIQWDIPNVRDFVRGQRPNSRHDMAMKFAGVIAKGVIEGKFTEEEGWVLFQARRTLDNPPKLEKEYWDEFQYALQKDRARKYTVNLDKLDQKYKFENAFDLFNEPVTESQWLIKDLMPVGLISIVGREKSYKSFLALHFAYKLASKGFALNKFEVPEAINVLIIDKENNRNMIKTRLKMFSDAVAVKDKIFFLPIMGTDFLLNKETAEWIVKKAKEHGAKLVILDSFYRFHGFDENDATQITNMAEWFGFINANGVSILFLHHMSKGRENEARGSTVMDSMVDASFRVSKKSNDSSLIVVNELARHKKENADYGIKVVSDETSIDFVYTRDTKTESEKRRIFDDDEIRSKIYEILEQSSFPMMGTNEIFNELAKQSITKDKPKFLTLIAGMIEEKLLKSKLDGQKIYYCINKDSIDINVEKLF